MIDGYFDRFDVRQNYEKHLFRAGFVLQSAELNEVQSSLQQRIQSLGESLFKDGDIVRDARIVVNSRTGQTTCQSGAIYLKGMVRGIAAANLTIPTNGLVTVGIYLDEQVITELEDADLRDPAKSTRNYQEAGAARLQRSLTWGYSGDGQDGEFYPIYQVENGQVRAKEPPPQFDAMTQALARYDRDSAGGSYVVSGLKVAVASNTASAQIYTIAEGRARVNGYAIELATGKRLTYPTSADLRSIDAEPHLSSTSATQRVFLDCTPLDQVTQVRVTLEKSVTLTHGGFTGAQDPLPDTAVLALLEVKQGTVTYALGSDYKLTAGKVDWTLSGEEPAPGSTYTVKYQYIASIQPSAQDSSSITLQGAVPGSQILISYTQKLPRIDRLCIDAEGKFVWLQGIAAAWNPQAPNVPPHLLGLASVYQTWDSKPQVQNDSVRVVPMTELAALNARLDRHTELIALQGLQVDINIREAGVKKGLFVDAFLSDDLRDAGSPQTAAIIEGILTLPVSANPSHLAKDVVRPTTLPYDRVAVLEQPLRTGSMLINPYQAFEPIPAQVQLTPAVDRWTEVETTWAGSITQRFSSGGGWLSQISQTTQTQVLSETRRALESLRSIPVTFAIQDFEPGEALLELRFDGINLTPSAN